MPDQVRKDLHAMIDLATQYIDELHAVDGPVPKEAVVHLLSTIIHLANTLMKIAEKEA